MSLTGITPNVTTELNNLLGKTAFQISKNKESTIEKPGLNNWTNCKLNP